MDHSAAPWHWEGKELCAADGSEVLAPTVECRSFCQGGYVVMPISEANANLIAVAPELLASVREFAAACGGCNGHGHLTYDTRDGGKKGDDCEDCEDLRALIAKATA